MNLEGNIIAGEYDEGLKEFSLHRVKHLTLESTIKENQLQLLYEYLKKHQDEEDGQILTLYDQILVRLTQEEINQFIQDLEQVQALYKSK
ncbi:hypothetical protein GCM10008967_17210 [Bacillus carboniphilus]|uniref:Group-specific protein n=1 Tax=Bacillus carboniphilus TaxID=86663 RepID=A0ABP3FVI6_9BACI